MTLCQDLQGGLTAAEEKALERKQREPGFDLSAGDVPQSKRNPELGGVRRESQDQGLAAQDALQSHSAAGQIQAG